MIFRINETGFVPGAIFRDAGKINKSFSHGTEKVLFG